jgi:DNA primase
VARYSDESRERVRDAVDFVAVVSARTELKKAGANRYTGRCPFHDERTPSFGIDPTEKLYHCFGCGAGGDLFTFVMETEGLGFSEALEVLADRFNVQLERQQEDPREAQFRERRERLWKLLERTAAYYVRVLWEAPEAEHAREYLRSRGLDEQTCRQFRVGYSPNAWEKVVGASMRAGFTQGELLEAGLAQRSPRGPIDRFRGRLMFPLTDRRGRVLGFGARALLEGDNPKYLNSNDNEVFKKGENLYAVDVARAGAAKAGYVVLAEGYTDVLALFQAGVPCAVGSMGTALTDRQAGLLVSMAPTVLLCMDADRAGQEAMVKAEAAIRRAVSGQAQQETVKVVPLPAGADPADIVAASGGTELVSLLQRAVPFPRFRVERALSSGDTGTPEGRDRVLDEVKDVIRPLPPSVLREELVQLVAGRLALSEGLVAAALGDGGAASHALVGGNGNGRNGASAAARALDRRGEAERAYLALCIAFPSAGRDRLDDKLFSTVLMRRAAAHLREHLDAPASGLPPDDPDLAGLIAELVLRARAAEGGSSVELDRAALHLELGSLDRRIAEARLEGDPVGDLAMERQRVLERLKKLTF